MHFLALFSEVIQILRRDKASISLLFHRTLLLSLITLHYIIQKHFRIINISLIFRSILFILLTKGVHLSLLEAAVVENVIEPLSALVILCHLLN